VNRMISVEGSSYADARRGALERDGGPSKRRKVVWGDTQGALGSIQGLSKKTLKRLALLQSLIKEVSPNLGASEDNGSEGSEALLGQKSKDQQSERIEFVDGKWVRRFLTWPRLEQEVLLTALHSHDATFPHSKVEFDEFLSQLHSLNSWGI